ncbi:MAG: c-type cytochrome [Opitutus sp.]|nr:c-type cytochrome [Opitutus sp.]
MPRRCADAGILPIDRSARLPKKNSFRECAAHLPVSGVCLKPTFAGRPIRPMPIFTPIMILTVPHCARRAVRCALGLALLPVFAANRSAVPDTSPEAGAAELPRSQPVAPANALATIETRRDVKLELVAAEPLVMNPIAMSFDEDGRLYVVEMLDYPEAKMRPAGRIRRLEDTDGDGKYDRATVFAEGLGWPSGIFCYAGGVFVAATPDLLYLRDVDGDGKADVREVIFTGFGADASPVKSGQMPNNLCWGPDNRIYVATAGNAGRLRRPGAPESSAIDLRNKDFSFDPLTWDLRLETGTAQYGQTFDDFGRRFVSSNHNHLRSPRYEYRYADRHPLVDFPTGMVDIAADGGAAELFRISPEEPWRIIRMKWRMSGLVRGGVEAGGKTSGYFTSACGVTIYRGDALPPEFRGNAFVADPANNIAHRKLVREDGTGFIAERPADERGTEFVRSRDRWFRPVNFATAPDGTLYIADMYRSLIEDPTTIPDGIVRHLDLAAGNDMGRIYRVVPASGFKQPAPPHLSTATAAELAALLAHPNGWYRDAASRLLYERQDLTAVSALEKLAQSPQPIARFAALYALHGLHRLAPDHLVAAAGDADAHVREHVARLAEILVTGARLTDAQRASLADAVARLAADPAPRVRCQAAFSLGALAGEKRDAALLAILRRDVGDDLVRAAVLSSVGDAAAGFFAAAIAEPTLLAGEAGRGFIGQLARLIGARGKPEEIATVVAFLAAHREHDAAPGWMSALGAGLRRAGIGFAEVDPQHRLDGMLADAVRVVANQSAAIEDRLNAAQLIATSQGPAVVTALLELVTPSVPQKLQLEAVAALSRRPGTEIQARLLERWPALTPRVREELVKALIARPERALLLLGAIREGRIRASDLSLTQRLSLRMHADPKVKALAAEVVGSTGGNRQKIVDDYQPALALKPDAAHGKKVFAATCASCHRFDGQGFELGPDLMTVKNGGKEKLLTSILDPNREVDPKYVFFQIETKDAGALLGAIVEETPGSISLKQAYGSQTTVARSNIISMKSLGQSMMPEGLEASLSKQDMADLLEYIETSGN